MNFLATALVIICSIGILTLPRKWAPLALLIPCCYLTLGQAIQVGGISVHAYRIVLLVSLIRIAIKGEYKTGTPLVGLDKIFIAFCIWIFVASFGHKFEPGSGPIYATGAVFNYFAAYFTIRFWIRSYEDAVQLIAIIAILITPLALEMLAEKATGRNSFSVLGGVYEYVAVRKGKLRAQASFGHPILAGSIGAACVPLMISIWKTRKSIATVGLIASITMVWASASSGPIMTLLAGLWAVWLWKMKHLTGKIRMFCIILYLVLNTLMTRPAYYLISKIDITGGSTGYHRSALIDSAFRYLNDWWLVGTDYTRHWMPYGLPDNPNHADITNYYLAIGVLAGLPAMLMLIWIVYKACRYAGRVIDRTSDKNQQFFAWCIGSSLFAHAVTATGVGYFDQSRVFVWLTISLLASLYSFSLSTKVESSPEPEMQLSYQR